MEVAGVVMDTAKAPPTYAAKNSHRGRYIIISNIVVIVVVVAVVFVLIIDVVFTMETISVPIGPLQLRSSWQHQHVWLPSLL